MELLPLRPAHLHKGADFDRCLPDRDLTAQESGLLQCAWRDYAQPALAHVVDAARDRAALGFFYSLGQLGDGDPEVLGEPSLFAPIAF